MCYLKIALTLRSEAVLFEFPYDWRLPIEINGDLLGQFLDRWAEGDDTMQFTLVGHSMGGLVSRAYVTRHPEEAKRRVERVRSCMARRTSAQRVQWPTCGRATA